MLDFLRYLAATIHFETWCYSVDLRQFLNYSEADAEQVRLNTLAMWAEDMALSGVRASYDDHADGLVLYADYEQPEPDYAAEIHAENAWLRHAERPDYSDRDLYPA